MNFAEQLARELQRCASVLPEWMATLRELPSRYSAVNHGDFERWRFALEQLDDPGTREAALRQLMPWRKGPWTFGGINIDTEWRSDWKWSRLVPHLPDLGGRRVLDVGCGNGYFGWRLLEAGAGAVIGVDPALLYCMQHLAAARLLGDAHHWVLPLTLEEAPSDPCFDLVLSMGVIYHRKDPVDHLRRLFACCRPGATVVLESLIVRGEASLYPPGRYARMRNVSVVPSIPALRDWLRGTGFDDPRLVDVTPTQIDEQRTTDWMPFESLREALDPADPSRTVEGHPAPVRAILLASRPVEPS